MVFQNVHDGLWVLATVALIGSFVASVAMGLSYRWRRQKAHRDAQDLSHKA
jgi:hypothetical protein